MSYFKPWLQRIIAQKLRIIAQKLWLVQSQLDWGSFHNASQTTCSSRKGKFVSTHTIVFETAKLVSAL